MTHLVQRLTIRSKTRPLPVVVDALPIIGMTAAMIAAAHLRARLPFSPVPATFQTLVVLLGGALFGARRGAAAQSLYLGLGAAGAPVLAGGVGGWAALAGPTGGYLAGFLLAATLVGRLLGGRPASWLRVLAVMAAGDLAILGCGAAYLTVLGVSPHAAIMAGVVPFLLWDAIKVGVGATSYQLISGRRN